MFRSKYFAAQYFAAKFFAEGGAAPPPSDANEPHQRRFFCDVGKLMSR